MLYFIIVIKDPQTKQKLGKSCDNQPFMAAAQNAVIAAESLGIGSCYIGDIIEHYAYHKDLFQLPDYVFPLALLCLGYYKPNYPRVHRKRFAKTPVVFSETYHCLTFTEYQEMFAEHEKTYAPTNPYGADNYAKWHVLSEWL